MPEGRFKRTVVLLLVFVLVMPSFGLYKPKKVQAATLLGDRYNLISDSRTDATARYEIGLTMKNTSQAVGSLVFEVCENDPIPERFCDVPAGLDVSGATLTAESGDAGFSIHSNTTANVLVLTRPPSNPLGVTSIYTFDDIINPSTEGTYYIRLYSYPSEDGTGVPIENGGIAYAINAALDISAEVPPFIRFCAAVTIVSFDCSSATSYFIDLGFLNTDQPRVATSQFVSSSNAEFGYSVSVVGTTLQSGNNAIPRLPTPSSSIPGTSQFGINLRSNLNPSVGSDVVGPGTAAVSPAYDTLNQFTYNNGDVVASVNHSDDNRKFTVSYLVNISNAQEPGIYSTTISFICLANF